MNILLFIGILLLLVIVHEAGHFFAAKKLGIRVDEFAFGFPPRLFGIKKGETEYVFNALPIGGYVKIFGEDMNAVAEDHPDRKRSFAGKPRWVQAIVIVSGVASNLLLAWFIIWGTLVIGVPADQAFVPVGTVLKDSKLVIGETLKGSPAELSGLRAGDEVIRAVADEETVIKNELITEGRLPLFFKTHPEATSTLFVLRNGVEQAIFVKPVQGIIPSGTTTPAIGVYLDVVGIWSLGPVEAIGESIKRTALFTKLTITGIFGLLQGVFVGGADFSQVTGPVGIVKVVGEASAVGVVSVMLLTALISINLAVINLLPFPALDGGRLLFILIETVIRRPLPVVFQQRANTIGFALLLLLMVVVTYHDIVKL